jgi:hypothetical protein
MRLLNEVLEGTKIVWKNPLRSYPGGLISNKVQEKFAQGTIVSIFNSSIDHSYCLTLIACPAAAAGSSRDDQSSGRWPSIFQTY